MKERNNTMGKKNLPTVTKAVSAALAVILLTLAPAGCSIDLYRDSGRRIAYEKVAGGNLRIYVIRMGSSTEIPLTGEGEYSFRPAWSPDGSRIAFQSYNPPDMSTLEVYVINGDGSGRVNISQREGLGNARPSWSPDGSKIAWLAGRSDLTTVTLMIADSDGSNPEELTPSLDVNNGCTPSWSPDGRKITVAVNTGTNPNLYVVNVETKISSSITSGIENHDYPAWSPDGKKIAYRHFLSVPLGGDGYNHICVINPDGTGDTELTGSGSNNIIPAWSPDSSKIAFLSDKENTANFYTLRVMNRDGTGSIQLNSNRISEVQTLNWAPDGKTILSVSGYGGSPFTLFVASLEGTVTPLVGPTADEIQNPSWTPR